MKTLENNHGGNWLDRLLNRWPLCLDMDDVLTLFARASDEHGVYEPDEGSLFFNGVWMVRVTWPFGIWVHVKPTVDTRIQVGAGWKLNGRFGLIARAQSDASAAAGTHGPNHGQARGWGRGTA